MLEYSVCSTVAGSASEERVIDLTEPVETDCGSPLLLCNVSSAAVVTIMLRQLPSTLACLQCRALCARVCCHRAAYVRTLPVLPYVSCSDEREIDHPPQQMC